MSRAIENDWREELGIEGDGGKSFIANKADISAFRAATSQGHVLRRAFDLLELEGILCTDSAPLVYFKQVPKIEAAAAHALHRTFWNHGGAPVLVLISPEEVHVYSGLIKPGPRPIEERDMAGLVEIIDRAGRALRDFLPSVESGAFFKRHDKLFDPANRVDRELLVNLQSTRDNLAAKSQGKLESKVLDALLCRLVFACYLFDRKVVRGSYLQSIGLQGAEHLRDVLGIQPRSRAKERIYGLFKKLGSDFNGDLFSDNLDAEATLIEPSFIDPLDDFFPRDGRRHGTAVFLAIRFRRDPRRGDQCHLRAIPAGLRQE